MTPSLLEPIAIIGTGCRFPGQSTSPSKLWELLREPRDVLTDIPTERFNPAGFYHPDAMHHDSTNVQRSYLLSEDYRVFDAQFFNIHPMEANAMDPQQRILLEAVYEATEAAGLPLENLRGSNTAVFVGLMSEDYSAHLLRDPDSTPIYIGTGTARSILSNRISYFFDWHGPSMTIDTACSSSLVSLHQAVQSLRNGESKIAVVGGTNLILSPEPFIAESKLKMLSPGSQSRMWDKDADGYARGDGIAAVVLKPLSAALRDGDFIECIIRETGVNQDGRTAGITMPSSVSQTELIRTTYERAGLDPVKDRPQYFEAHGTGTPAGDPIEAEAICRAFFDSRDDTKHETPLYCGSIKTVIGHTEGTAGLAGVIKASLALRHREIPPNLLFKSLNPSVKPFYKNLEIPSGTIPWPSIPEGQNRRVSVNSFGFGGTNAHVILESFKEPELESPLLELPLPIPFVFSAASGKSLSATLVAHAEYLKSKAGVDINRLAHTLRNRRSILPVRTAMSASTREEIIEKIEISLTPSNDNPDTGIRGHNTPPRILGVFTGQGAQWVGMGRELLLQSKFIQQIISDLDTTLQKLPSTSRPTWSLKNELLADPSTSRLHEAAISQPLCTAVQIVLVEILRHSGVEFQAVVGHSSGEIGAAYAAGYISAASAIIIAYYRGFHAQLARSPNGTGGAMLAIGTSVVDATEFCEHEDMQGRVCVAACNSSSSVTISGDIDAIEEAKEIFDDEKKFVRMLKVDTAYHSHHMLACSNLYIESLRQSSIQVGVSSEACCWISSVEPGKRMSATDDLKDTYWNENMVQPVLFSQAVEAALAAKGPLDMAIEIGPHPALKGPALQCIQESTGQMIPYLSLLERSKNAVDTLSDSLGSLWTHFGPKGIDLSQSSTALAGVVAATDKALRPLSDLPIYSWDHDKIHWFESRTSKAYRTRSKAIHPLLGTASLDNTEDRMCWKNLLRPSEIPWLHGHQLQNQMIFPAAGYVVTAFEAARQLANKRSIRLLEMESFTIGRSITFEEDYPGVEIAVALTDITTMSDSIRASFTYHAGLGKCPETLTLISSGCVNITLGECASSALPDRPFIPANLVDINSNLFYGSLEQLGYQYTGLFKSLTQMRRKLNMGTACVTYTSSSDLLSEDFLIHPSTLDATFQALFLACCHPGDGTLQDLHVPVSIRSIRINPYFHHKFSHEASLPLDCRLDPKVSSHVNGDIDIFAPTGNEGFLQIEGLTVAPFASASSAQDHALFSQCVWDVASPDGNAVAQSEKSTPEELEFQLVAEQVALYYLKKVVDEITDETWAKSEPHYKLMREYAKYSIAAVESGEQPFTEARWLANTREEIFAMTDNHPQRVELQIMRAVGENLPAAIQGHTNILEHMIEGNALTRFYEEETGIECLTVSLARTAKQLTFRYPHMKILEIGAGTGGATKKVLRHIGDAFASYTFTDISTGFFEEAREVFKDHESGMDFKALDIEKDIVEQGFVPHSYDLVIASLVLHATSNIERTMKNVRRLLKPGGFVMMLELTAQGPMKMAFVFCGLPGWWLGVGDGRVMSPNLTSAQWHTTLRKTGFSGVDMITPEDDFLVRPGFVITSQATDDRISALRSPQTSMVPETGMRDLIILGGTSLQNSRLVDSLIDILRPHCTKVTHIEHLEELSHHIISPSSTVLSLTDLDTPIFKRITESHLTGLKHMLNHARLVLWVSQGCRSDDPYANIMVGFGRTLSEEMGHVRFQHLDLEYNVPPRASLLAETLLRTYLLELWEEDRRSGELLWSLEPEMVQEKGQLLVQRLLPNIAANDRYNSLRREIIKPVDPKTFPVRISYSETSYNLVEESETSNTVKTPGHNFVSIQVSHSLLFSVQISSEESYFLVLGNDIVSGEAVAAFSTAHASLVEVPKDLVFPIDIAPGQESTLLHQLANNLIAQYLLNGNTSKSTVVLHEPESLLAATILKKASKSETQVRFTTTLKHLEMQDMKSWIYLHPMSSTRVAKKMLPESITVFVDLSDDGAPKVIQQCLSPHCKFIDTSQLFGGSARRSQNAAKNSMMLSALLGALESLTSDTHSNSAPLIALSDLPRTSITKTIQIVDWRATSTVPTSVRPIDSQTLFSHSKTYILFGLTGDLGRSLCEWMVTRGAKTIVLTSRNPLVEQSWIASLEQIGAHIKVFSNDITDITALSSLVKEIRATLPPVGGIANGAMFLRDVMIPDMDFDVLVRTLGPKVDGARYLNKLFPEKDLEFCVFFSSVAAIWGNRGQASYSGANMFSASLVNQRRKMGLSASVIHIGPILGAGYVSNADQKLRDSLDKAGWVFSSESDFHQSFAEAVVAGRPGSVLNPDIVFGMRRTKVDPGADVQWFDNPKFQHCANQNKRMETNKEVKPASNSPKEMLLGATSNHQVYMIIQDAFITKLQVVLQLEPVPDDQKNTLTAKGADGLGMDSLVAVQVRSWLLKEFEVDVQVLKILGGATIREIIEYAQEKLPREMIPHVVIGTSEELAPPEIPGVNTSPQPTKVDAAGSDSEVPETDNSTDLEHKLLSSTDWSSSDSESIETPYTPDIVPGRHADMGYGQARFWALRSLLEDKTTFNITCSASLSGHVRVSDLANAVQAVCQMHEALRTVFFEDESHNYRQAVVEASRVKLETKMVSNETDIAEEFKMLNEHVFDLSKGDTFRVMLLTLSPTSHVFTFSYDHIIMDGLSLEIFLSDLIAVYEGKPPRSNVSQYLDFSVREMNRFGTGGQDSETSFWRKEYPDIPPPLPLLPFAATKSRKMMTRYEFNKVEFKLNAAISTRIKATCQRNKSTPFHFHLAAFKTLLFRLLDVDDLSIGIADSNRVDNHVLGSVGMYLNLLPLSAKHSPIFQAFVNYRQGVQEKRKFGECEAEGLKYEIARSANDLALDIIDNPGGDSTIAFMVQKSLYSSKDAEYLSDCYLRLLDAFSNDDGILERKAPIFSKESIQVASQLGRGPLLTSEWGETLCHQIARFAQRDDLAVKDGMGSTLTHREMARRINDIASALRSNVVAGSNVAMFQFATADWICSMLAIWTVGAVYVPLDPRIPDQRLESIIKDCRPDMLLSHDRTHNRASQLKSTDMTILNVSTLSPAESSEASIKALPTDRAAIFYTSGSTGTPKGIVLKHSGLLNEIEGTIHSINLPPGIVLQQSALGFDMSVWQVFMGLSNGGSVYIVSQAERGDPLALSSLIQRERITFTGATPSEYSSWLRFGSWHDTQHWAFALCGGEAMTQAVVRQFRDLASLHLRLFNWYGPTEISFSNNKIEIPYQDVSSIESSTFPVGFTSPNCATYIVDDNLNLLPNGFSGEVLIGGAGVAIGYLNNPGLTSQAFIPDIFNPSETTSKPLLHRTGDRGYLCADGALVIEGRITGDSQVKLRGIRIDMRDIEAVIAASAGGAITSVAVTLRNDSGLLVAFIVFSSTSGNENNKEGFLKELSPNLALPQYMQPAVTVPVDELPVNNHGKLDRLALQTLPIPTTDRTTDVAHLNDMEHQLSLVWQRVLGKQANRFYAIDKDSDFFHVGGNSALLVRLQSLIRNTFDVVLPLVELFGTSTLGEMASKISSSVHVSSIDWIQETSLDFSANEGPLFSPEKGANLQARQGRVVLLTGSTGFLGKSILCHLVQDPEVSKVHCVAIRKHEGSTESKERDLGIVSEKIEQHSGNLADPFLGLSAEKFAALSQEIDLVIHCGAQRSFWGHYQLFRNVNVLSTKELVKMAIPRRVPIHFVSSGGVLLLDQDQQETSYLERSLASHPPPADGSNGYLASKWASEKVLENATSIYNVPVSIFRPTPTLGENTTSSSYILEEFLQRANEMRALPTAEGWTADFDLLPLEKFTRIICTIPQTLPGGPRVKFVHCDSEVKVTSEEVSDYLEMFCEGKADFERLHATEWMGAIKKKGFGYIFASQKMVLDPTVDWSDSLVSQR
ncbi:Hybrid PKS-NRPS synthetase prlS [Lachnellula arida]|uniref:Hybrid PKS-NRPS synthetase prlS n=1 Tax=Lachnellula arida TaxID=1316785 RepID=A0A8T9BHF1_9HELO|nr:Hybrid PKS-NRPS synthetase prlS [Lachnellula arida]